MHEHEGTPIQVGARVNVDAETVELVLTSYPVCDRLKFYVLLGKHAIKNVADDMADMVVPVTRLKNFQMPAGSEHEKDPDLTVFSFADPNQVAALRTLVRLSMALLEGFTDRDLQKYPGSDSLEQAQAMRKDDIKMATAIFQIAEKTLDQYATPKAPGAKDHDLN